MTGPGGVCANARVLGGPRTGVQRYAREVLGRLDGVAACSPERPLHGLKGHLWEQATLPRLAAGRLLWSPGNTGPLRYGRQVVTIHDTAFLDVPGAQKPLFRRWYRFLVPRLGQRARHVIAVSGFTRDRLVQACGLDADRVAVIPNGVDHAVFRPSKAGAEASPSTPYVLTVGTLEPRKNIPALLAAWSRSSGPRRGVRLVVVGAAGKSDVFEAVDVRPADGVELRGHVSDAELAALYSGATLVVAPSLYEGFGLPCLEAMACGAPLLHNRIPPFEEVVGDAGLAVDATRRDELAAALDRLLSEEDLRRDLARRGLERARQYSWDRTAATTAELLRACAEEGR